MATSTIGATGRDFTEIKTWEASLTTAQAEQGDVYDDAALADNTSFVGHSATSIIVTVPVAERHDGTEGTGSRVVNSNTGNMIANFINDQDFTIEWMEFDKQGGNTGFIVNASGNGGVGDFFVFDRLLVHDLIRTGAGDAIGLGFATSGEYRAHNCIVYDISSTDSGADFVAGIGSSGGSSRKEQARNCTVWGVTNDNGTGDSYGFFHNLDNGTLKLNSNCAAFNIGGTASGSQVGYQPAAPTNIVYTTNASFDETGTPTTLDSLTDTDQFTDTSARNFLLKSGATLIDAGTDLGTLANVDILGRDRDSEGDTWDVGAHEFVAVGGLSIPVAMHSYRRRRV